MSTSSTPVQAFICFGLLASGTYILNDLGDLPDDRKHRSKRNRPLASGALSIPTALAAMSFLILISLLWAFFISKAFLIVLLTYAVMTVAYSVRLKRIAIIDVTILAGLFCLRVFAGGIVLSIFPTAWLLAFIGFVFLSLALAKRYVEVSKLERGSTLVSGRGYQFQDASLLMIFGVAAAFSAVLSLIVYGVVEPERLIETEEASLIIATIMAAWFMRLWLIAGRGHLDDDPVIFAIKDTVSLCVLALISAIVLASETMPVWVTWF